MTKSKRFIAFLIVTLFIVIVIYNHFFLEIFAAPDLIKTQLNDLQKEIVSHTKEINNLLISLSTGIFVLIGYMSTSGGSGKFMVQRKSIIPLILCFCFSALSIDFGYIFMQKWIQMLHLGIFNPEDNLVKIPHILQIISFLLSLIFLAILIINSITQQNVSNDNP